MKAKNICEHKKHAITCIYLHIHMYIYTHVCVNKLVIIYSQPGYPYPRTPDIPTRVPRIYICARNVKIHTCSLTFFHFGYKNTYLFINIFPFWI